MIADAHGDLTAVFRKDPNHRLALPKNRAACDSGPKVFPVQPFRRGEPGGGAKRGIPIGELAGSVAHRAGLHRFRKADDHRHANPAFQHAAFEAAKTWQL